MWPEAMPLMSLFCMTCIIPCLWPCDKRKLNLVEANWASWLAWTVCSVTCGEGTIFRQRICPQSVYGGLPCNGIDHETSICGRGTICEPGKLLFDTLNYTLLYREIVTSYQQLLQ